MGYPRGNYRYGGGDRGRDRERGGRSYSDRERDFDRGYRDDDDDRGFIDRAGDEVRSWFGDEEAERRREADRLRYENESRYGDRDRDYRDEGRRERLSRYEDDRYVATGESWAGSGFGGDYDRGRRFDRIDVGSTGTHGAHPMSAPAGAEGYLTGARPRRDRSFARDYAAYESGRDGRPDPHYHEWRARQIDALDRDYDEYRREHQSQFEQEFGSWREKRRTQRDALRQVGENMEVVGSDGGHLGTVDKVRGDRIILTKSDPAAGGHHHSIPCGWIDKVEDRVVLNRSTEQARRAWTDEETSRALFEREDDMREGPHALDRSFSGTY